MGIDPGYATTGVAVLETDYADVRVLHYGVLETSKKQDFSERLQYLFREIGKMVETWKPDVAAVEELFFSRNVKTGIKVAEARGVILLALKENNCPAAGYTPVQIKQAITGSGSAVKAQVQKMVKLIFGFKEIPKPDDAADAIAIAYAHCSHRPLVR